MAYDPTTDIGKVRLQIGDTAEVVFTDAEIQAFLDRADDSIARASAMALRAMAAAYAQLASKAKALDVEATFPGPAALLELADGLDKADDEDGAFAFAEMVPNNVYAVEERIQKDAQRE